MILNRVLIILNDNGFFFVCFGLNINKLMKPIVLYVYVGRKFDYYASKLRVMGRADQRMTFLRRDGLHLQLGEDAPLIPIITFLLPMRKSEL